MSFIGGKAETVIAFENKLKKLREEAGLSKEEVARLLNIPPRYIDFLEEGEISQMPGGVYTRGILKKYAKILKTDPAELLDNLEENERSVNFKKNNQFSLPALNSRRFTVTPRFVGLIFGGLLLFLIGGYFFYQLSFLIKPPKLVVFEPAGDMAVNRSSIVIKGQAEPGSKLTINGQEIYIDKDGYFEREINLNQGLNEIKIKATTRFEKSTSMTRKILVK